MSARREKLLNEEAERVKQHVGHTIRYRDIVGGVMKQGVLVRVSREPKRACIIWLEVGATFPKPVYLETVFGCIDCEANQKILPEYVADCPKCEGGLMLHTPEQKGQTTVNWYTCRKCDFKATPGGITLRETK